MSPSPRRFWPPCVPLIAGACAGPFAQSTLAPASDFGWVIHDLYAGIVWWALAVFAVVEGLLLYALVRFRRRPGAAEPRPVHGHTLLEIAWTLAPAMILIFIAVPTIRVVFRTAGHAPADALRVEVVGHQWWWEYRYPDLGIVTANELHLPVGRPAALALTSADVIHSFWAPRLGGKRDVIQGRVTRLALTPDSIGEFAGQCAEFCGTSHAHMALRVVVESDSAFRAWVAAQQDPAPDPAPTSSEERGLQAFRRYGCLACHGITGVSPRSTIGPDLTHLGGRRTIAGASFPNSPEALRAWIADPPGRKPGALMPNLNVRAEDLDALVAYLRSLR